MPSVPQKVCPSCTQLTPSSEPACAYCGAAFRNEMAWKIPFIVLLFLAAFALAFWIQTM